MDCGGATQGEPINYVWAQLNRKLPEPTMAIMNSLGYSAMVVGAQEFALGISQLRAMEEQAQFPWLAANVYSSISWVNVKSSARSTAAKPEALASLSRRSSSSVRIRSAWRSRL